MDCKQTCALYKHSSLYFDKAHQKHCKSAERRLLLLHQTPLGNQPIEQGLSAAEVCFLSPLINIFPAIKRASLCRANTLPPIRTKALKESEQPACLVFLRLGDASRRGGLKNCGFTQ